MNKTKIEWCDYTWNPVTGCARKPPCDYCYARKISNRFHPDRDFAKLEFHRDRLILPQKIINPVKIFVGSMTDFCYWKTEWKNLVTGVALIAHWHTYMFLSKGNDPYREKWFPINCMLGSTLNGRDLKTDINRYLTIMDNPRRRFVSYEPLLGGEILNKSYFEADDTELVIVGAMTGPGAVKPEKEWINTIKDRVPSDKIFWKENIKEYL